MQSIKYCFFYYNSNVIREFFCIFIGGTFSFPTIIIPLIHISSSMGIVSAAFARYLKMSRNDGVHTPAAPLILGSGSMLGDRYDC